MTIVLYIVFGFALLGGVEAMLARRSLRVEIQNARRQLPTDSATGLLNHRAYLQRISGELKRAKRSGGTVWLSVWTVVEGDADQFGRVAADGLRFPEVGFRLSDQVFCFARPNATDEQRGELAMRVRNGAPRTRAAVGEVHFRSGDSEDAMQLLHEAIGKLH